MGVVLKFRQRSVAPQVKSPNAKVCHLMTQRDQPYGSMRRCCEMCGAMIPGTDRHFTDKPAVYENLSVNYVRCIDVEKERRSE